MKHLQYVALFLTLASFSPLGAFAKDKNVHSVNLADAVQIGTTQLKPGSYKVEWQGTGPNVQVNFLHEGKTVATVPGTLKTNEERITRDEIVTDPSSTGARALKEIDFGHQKEALVFSQSGM
jgi:hypothetical protein